MEYCYGCYKIAYNVVALVLGSAYMRSPSPWLGPG